MLAYSALLRRRAWRSPARCPTAGRPCWAGSTLAAVVVCGYALLTKVFPAQFDANDVYARLRAPYDYWNAIGLTAAMGVDLLPVARRPQDRARAAERARLPGDGADARDVDARLFPRRARRAGARAGGVVLHRAAAPARSGRAARGRRRCRGGGRLGLLQARADHRRRRPRRASDRRDASSERCSPRCSSCSRSTGLAVGFLTARRAPSRRSRRRAGAALLAILALAVVAFAGALAVSHRGLPGSVSHAFHSLTDTNAKVSNTPGRLTAIASVRARYWSEALKVFDAHPAAGGGRGRVPNGAPALPHGADRSAPRPRLRRADACRPRARRTGARPRAARGLDGRRRAPHAPLQPALDGAGARLRGRRLASWRFGWRRDRRCPTRPSASAC